MNDIISHIKKKTKEYAQEWVDIRRHLHAYPELSFKEYKTAAYIQEKLAHWHIPYMSVAQTGVYGWIEGKNKTSRVVALRADIDALPIQEDNDLSFMSTEKGIMHACGHDVHTSCLLIAAKILQETKEEWEGTVKLIFQPAEEIGEGALSMMKENILSNPSPELIYGLHVLPLAEKGSVLFKENYFLASVDNIDICIKSNGGHAASPHVTSDIVLIASQLILYLQQIISRQNNSVYPSVLSFCSIHGGHTTNVIPNELTIKGTLRCLNEDNRRLLKEKIKKQVVDFVQSMNAEAFVQYIEGVPTLVNHSEATRIAYAVAKEHLPEATVGTCDPFLFGEDFAYYLQKYLVVSF